MGRLNIYIGNRQVVKQGGISNKVWEEPLLQKYVRGINVFGYVGAHNRTIKSDKILMRELKNINSDIIADWMTSGTGRHFADGLYLGISENEIRIRVREYTKGIVQDVAIWRHPEFKGTLASKTEIKQKYFK